MPQDFKKLDIWKESFDLGIEIYQNVIEKIPEWEKYGLRSQLGRAVVSISCNIAEGTGKKTPRDFANFLYTSIGSAKEVENLLMFINKLGYIPDTQYKELNTRLLNLGGKIMNFLKSVETKVE